MVESIDLEQEEYQREVFEQSTAHNQKYKCTAIDAYGSSVVLGADPSKGCVLPLIKTNNGSQVSV